MALNSSQFFLRCRCNSFIDNVSPKFDVVVQILLRSDVFYFDNSSTNFWRLRTRLEMLEDQWVVM